MITSSFTLYGIEDAQQDVLVLSTHAVTVSAYNVQRDPLLIRVNHLYGSHTESLYAYVLVRIMSVDLELGQHDFGLCTEASYTLPVDKWGSATRIVVEAYTDEAHRNLIVSESVSIIAENPTPFPITEPWGPGYRYKNGEYLLVGDVVYMWRNRVTGNTLTAPDKVAVSDPFYGSWQRHEQWALLVTQMFMAKSALIGSSVFDGDFTISQHGQSKGNNPDTGKPYDYRDFDEAMSKFVPNLVIDWLRGKVIGKDIEITGGKIGELRIEGSTLKSDTFDSSIEIEGGVNRKLRLGGNIGSLIGMRIDDAPEGLANIGLSIESYGRGNTCLRLLANAGGKYALDSIGPHRFYQRSGETWIAPGVLYAGHFGGDGVKHYEWGQGAGAVSCQRSSQGQYTITHELALEDYFVVITPFRTWAYATPQSKEDKKFWFTITEGSHLIDLEFDVIIYGRPVYNE